MYWRERQTLEFLHLIVTIIYFSLFNSCSSEAYCRLPFSDNDPGNGYLFTSLSDLQHTSWQTVLSSRVYRNPCVTTRTKIQRDDTRRPGIGCADGEARSYRRNCIALYALDVSRKPSKEPLSQIPVVDSGKLKPGIMFVVRLQALTLFFPWLGLHVLESIQIRSLSMYLFFKIGLKTLKSHFGFCFFVRVFAMTSTVNFLKKN